MKIVIVAGEVSGDLLGSKLAKELYKTGKITTISGIGGDAMRKADVETLHDVSETSVVGIVEVLKHYPRLRKILSNVKNHLRKTKPELIILIDYPEFNLKLAKYAKTLNIKVLFYVSPQVWAWRTGRVKKIKQCVDLMAVLFPFEVDFYQQANIPVVQVRHHVLTDIDIHYAPMHSSRETITIGLAPGSRSNEINKLFPIMVETADLLRKNYSNLRFLSPVAPSVEISLLESLNKLNVPIEYSKENFYLTIKSCDIVAISSGTATLQTALMGKAMVVIYKISPMTYKLLGHMVKVDHISLANIILKRRAYTELIQDDACSDYLYSAMSKLINNQEISAEMTSNRDKIYQQLDSGITTKELAEKALELAEAF